MDDISLAWAAGLFEGEGCISLSRPKQRDNIYLYLSLSMTDQDVVEKFCEIVGMGRVHGHHAPSRQALGHSPQWRWQVKGDKAEDLIWKFSPHLGERRRERFTEALLEIRAHRARMDTGEKNG